MIVYGTTNQHHHPSIANDTVIATPWIETDSHNNISTASIVSYNVIPTLATVHTEAHAVNDSLTSFSVVSPPLNTVVQAHTTPTKSIPQTFNGGPTTYDNQDIWIFNHKKFDVTDPGTWEYQRTMSVNVKVNLLTRHFEGFQRVNELPITIEERAVTLQDDALMLRRDGDRVLLRECSEEELAYFYDQNFKIQTVTNNWFFNPPKSLSLSVNSENFDERVRLTSAKPSVWKFINSMSGIKLQHKNEYLGAYIYWKVEKHHYPDGRPCVRRLKYNGWHRPTYHATGIRGKGLTFRIYREGSSNKYYFRDSSGLWLQQQHNGQLQFGLDSPLPLRIIQA